MEDLKKRVRQLRAGRPVGTLTYNGGNSVRDERGVIFRIQPSESEAQRRRMYAQKMAGRKAGFVFCVMPSMRYVGQVLTASQCCYLLVLSTYMDYEGRLVRSERDHTPLRQRDMIDALQLKRTQKSAVSKFVKAALNYGIMQRDEDGAYRIAHGVHFRGKNQDGADVVRAYNTQVRALAAANKAQHVGFVYKLLPYMHKTSNILCSNPDELEPSKVAKLRRKDLAQLTGVHEDSISRVIRSMQIEGRPVFAKITTATNGTFYMLNPAIFRRADDVAYDITARTIFKNPT